MIQNNNEVYALTDPHAKVVFLTNEKISTNL